MKTLRVAIIADYREERWPSMDLVAEMLAAHLPQVIDSDVTVQTELICPPMKLRFSSGSEAIDGQPGFRTARNADRFINRFLDYPRYLRKIRNSFDLFHVVDHSYSQMVHELPQGRVLVSCHDVDTFRCLWEKNRRSFLFRTMVRRTLSGLKKAAHVFCNSEATRSEVLHRNLMSPELCSVVLNGLRDDFLAGTPILNSDKASDVGSDVYILHVGSTIPRKRIDFLLKVFHAIQTEVEPRAKLIRVGGAFNVVQQALVEKLGIGPSIEVMPFLSTQELAIAYSGASLLLLTSDAEGFGFPIIEGLSRGIPVLASDIPVLREVGGTAARFAPLDDVGAWVTAAQELLNARKSPQFPNMQLQYKEWAGKFSWPKAAGEIVKVYKKTDFVKKIRVLQVGKYYAPFKGGMESSLELLCRGLKDHTDLEVLVANESNAAIQEDWNGVKVHRLAQQLKAASSPICLGLWRAMRAARADIVHIHLPNPLALLTFHLGGISGRLICTYHSDIVKQRILAQIIEPLQEAALKRCAALIAGTPQLIESSPVLSRHKDRCVVIPFGLRDSCFHPAESGEVAALRLKFPGPIILGVGRLVYYKGFEILIQAFARGKSPGTLLIVGEGPLREKLEKLIAELGLAGRVILTGSVPETAPYFEACDVFVLSSVAKTETFGVVQLEAMARSKPVINTNLESGVTFVSIHEETGLTVPVGNVEALADAINRLLQDAPLRKKYGDAGYQRVISEFTAEKMVSRTLELYEQVMQK